MAARDTSAADEQSGPGRTPRRLVIVESPTKARKIAPYLGRNYTVEASVGHIRDLPRGAADVPANYKGKPWARLGVDVDHDFEPLYVVSPDKKAKVTELKSLLKDADELYLATDPDREGEAIAWHLLQTLKPQASRSGGWSSTRSPSLRSVPPPRTPAISTTTSSTPRRPAASSTVSTATRSAPCCGRRSCRGCRRAACSRWRPASSCSASASAWRSVRPNTGTSPPRSTPATRCHRPRTFGARLVSVDGSRVATGRDFGPDGR